MTNEDPDAPTGASPPRRSPRQGIGGSPVGSTLSIVLAVVAVVVGFLILQNITDSDSSASDGGAPSETSVANTVGPVVTEPTVTTDPPLVTEGATVIVANASGVSQSAAGMTTELAAAGFTMGEATNATSSGLTASLVYYDPSNAAAQAVAESVAEVMGGLDVAQVPTPVPVDGETLGGAGVLVMLGTDEAGKTLEEIAPAGNVAAPEVSGGTTGDQTTTDDTTG